LSDTARNFSLARYGSKRPLRFLNKRIQHQREVPLETPLKRRIEIWRSGNRDVSHKMYDLSSTGTLNYLPDLARLETYFINSSLAKDILGSKLLFAKLLEPYLTVPNMVALVIHGKVFAEGRAGEGIVALADRHGSIVLKPSRGSHGRGVRRLETSPLRLNGERVSEGELQALVATLDNYLVTETVQQAAYAESIFPQTTNTVRVMTFVDPDTEQPFIARAVHRFGTKDTVPTDNWSGGGLCALVEIETGRLGRGVKHIVRTGGKLAWQSHHPDTGAPIEGIHIPGWAQVCDALLGAVRALPFLLYVGWDVAVTDNGPCIIEGNGNPDIDLLQVHGGLLSDPRVRRFYEHHRVI
jgi:glutathione synthase/RimK-type ligase-like ATP-grasp enzyme